MFQNHKVVNKKTVNLCKMNLRKRTEKINNENSSALDKENVQNLKLSNSFLLKNNQYNSRTRSSNVKQTALSDTVKEKRSTFINVPKSNKYCNLEKPNNLTVLNYKTKTTFQNTSNIAPTCNIKSSVTKTCPVWKCIKTSKDSNCLQKERAVKDIYDISEDEDLRKELNNKNKIKLNLKRKHKLCKKTDTTSNPRNKSSKNVLKNKKHSQNKNQQFKVEVSSQKEIIIDGDQLKSDEPRLKKACKPIHFIYQNIENKETSFTLPEKSTEISDHINVLQPLNENQIIKIVNTPFVGIDKVDKIALTNIPVYDTDEQLHRETTPIRETQLNFLESSFTSEKENFEIETLIPIMTSTPENDCPPHISALVKPKTSFTDRISEIPAITKVGNDLVDIESEEKESLYSYKANSSELNLFYSPPKINCDQQKFKRGLKTCLFTKNLEDNDSAFLKTLSNTQSEIFVSPEKNKKGKVICHKKLTNNLSKSRKSYDNRTQIRRNISKWKKIDGIKKKSANEEKEEKLVQSLNEHFSELESYELCFD